MTEGDTKASRWAFRLYVNGSSPRAYLLEEAVTGLLNAHLPGNHSLEVVDLHKNPSRGEEDKILALPTLVRLNPAPVRKIIGDLANTPRMIVALDLPRAAQREEQRPA